MKHKNIAASNTTLTKAADGQKREAKKMSRNYLSKILVYSLNNNGTNPAPHKDDMTNLTIEIGLAGITVLLMISLFIFIVIALS